MPVVVSPCLVTFSGAGSLSSSILIRWRQSSTMSSERRFDVQPDSKIISLLSDIIPMMPSFICHCFSCFLIMSQEDYLEEVLIIDTKKGLSVTMDIQEFIKWVGYWLYMVCWVGIESCRYWWSMETSLMAKCAPFILNCIMYRNRFICFWLCSQRNILRKYSFPRPTRVWVCQWIFKSL